jgi:hypothetical protein
LYRLAPSIPLILAIKSLYPGPLRRLCLSLPRGGVSTCREDGVPRCRDDGHSHRFRIFPSSYIEGLMFIHLVTFRYSFIVYNHSVLEIPFLRLPLLLCARRLSYLYFSLHLHLRLRFVSTYASVSVSVSVHPVPVVFQSAAWRPVTTPDLFGHSLIVPPFVSCASSPVVGFSSRLDGRQARHCVFPLLFFRVGSSLSPSPASYIPILSLRCPNKRLATCVVHVDVRLVHFRLGLAAKLS